MQIPVDVKAIFDEATNVENARNIPITVSVLLDDTAPMDLIAFVRSSFASASPQARISINYFHDEFAAFDVSSDMAVIAAGITTQVGAIVQDLHNAGIPTMVITTLPEIVAETAKEQRTAIPEGDLIAPVVSDGDVILFNEPIHVSSQTSVGQTVASSQAINLADSLSLEPYALTDTFAEQLRDRMGAWVTAIFHEKRLAFAQAFDFVRKPLSLDSIKTTSAQNAVIGFVAIIPGADLPLMTLNQAKMLLQIAAAYGQPMNAERIKELACVIGGGFACRSAARQLVGVVPALGWAIKAAVGYTGTQAMGHTALEYFEHGGHVSGMFEAVEEAREKVVNTAKETRVGQTAMEAGRIAGEQVKKAASDKAKAVVKAVPGKASSFAKNVVHTTVKAARNTRCL